MQRTPAINNEFRNQKLIVVGGTSGISKAISQLVLRQGGKPILIGRREDNSPWSF